MHSNFGEVKVPLIAVQCLLVILDSFSNRDEFHKDRIPPEFPIDGLKIHSISSIFQIDLIIFSDIFSIFVSWTNTKDGLIDAICFRRALLLGLPPRPLIFHEKTDIALFYILDG